MQANAGPAEFILGDAGTLADALGLRCEVSGYGPPVRISWIPVGAGEARGINLLPIRASGIEHPVLAGAHWDVRVVPRSDIDALVDDPLPEHTEAFELPPAAIDELELTTAFSVDRARTGAPSRRTTTTVMSSASSSPCVTCLELSTKDCAMPAQGTPHRLRCITSLATCSVVKLSQRPSDAMTMTWPGFMGNDVATIGSPDTPSRCAAVSPRDLDIASPGVASPGAKTRWQFE